jgi:hypothetical protein
MTARPIDFKRARQGLARLDALLETYPELREPDAQARLAAWLDAEVQDEMATMADYAEKTRARVQRLRERRKREGWTQHELWLDPASTALMTQLMQPGENVSGVVQRALQALAQPSGIPEIVTSNDSSIFASIVTSNAPIDMMDPRQRKAAVVARLREMYEQQKLSYQKIADQLTAEGVPTLSGDGRWHKKTVYKLLKPATPRSDR